MAKILVGEDDPSISYLVKLLLQRHNHEVATAVTKSEIENQLAIFDPDLVILDINLSGEDGREICRKIKSARKNLKVILSSANKKLLAGYEECLADLALQKPFDIAQLAERIQLLLKHSETR